MQANPMFAIALILTSGCGQRSPESQAVGVALPQLPTPPPYQRIASCKAPNTEFSRLSNAWGHGSFYYGIIDKCSDGIKIVVDLWTADHAYYSFESDYCPDQSMDRHGASMPKIDDRRDKINSELAQARHSLESELTKFKIRCGVASGQGLKLLDGFEDFYAGELKSSWIHNHYIEALGKIDRLGWGDEKLKKEAIEAYAQTH